jgi:GNAT superfamily N-acetyltransferase
LHVLIDNKRMGGGMVEFEISPLEELDPARYEQALRELDEGEVGYEGVVYCRAFEGDDEVGNLVINAAGKILGVEVKPEYRRKGIATRMFDELAQAGYRIEHDWGNMGDDGAAWAASLGPRTP